MSSDEYFDELDSAFLKEVDVIEASHTTAPPRPGPPRTAAPPRPSVPAIIEIDGSDDFGSFAIDDNDIEIIDKLTDEALGSGAPKAGPSRAAFARIASKATVQTTLDGRRVTEAPRNGPGSQRPFQRHNSNSNNALLGQPKKSKQWDHTAFAKTGWRKPQGAKGKERALGAFGDEMEDEEDEEPEEFEQFPAPFVSVGPPSPMKLEADRLAARRWVYPLNQPRRDYQFNIVRRCLFENTLVALPTGLGKTFIAGVVMLNFYTWFPEGKVVFVAPTKPLVAQQIEACHKTCGIPGSHAAELTGQNPRAVRARAWQEKRVFYMTPQTLMNDLKTDNCDPRDIVLLVIDEAHKGTGDYAYAQVIRYLMAKNPHFRVLALTATPGSKPEAVQAIVDSLHISHIEIRDEQSLDLAPYLHKKRIEQHIIAMSPEVNKIRDMLAEVMTPMIQKLYNAKLLHGNPKPVSLHPFSCTKALSMLSAGRNKGGNQWAYPMLAKLGALARVMGYLIEGSLKHCHEALHDLMNGSNGTATKQPGSKSKPNQYQQDAKLQAVMQELEGQLHQPGGFAVHPKMDKMRTLLVEHFAQKKFDKEDAQTNGGGEHLSGDSRVMVFVSFRHCVDEVIALLESEKPLIRAIPFIGQGTDKNGKRGYGQKEQLEVIKRFKAGEFNVLISTSIGEEGLDIGEIDMIICYDAQKTPIRMLQRIGRTGRKREGLVHVLLSEDREERNWDKADDNYKDVQRFIIKAEHLELYDDVERLIPKDIKPECIEMVMEIEEYIREDPDTKKGSRLAAKRVRDDNVMRNIPTGASTSFVSVKDLIKKGSKKKKKVGEFDELAGEDDSDDLEIAAGITGIRRTSSVPTGSKSKKSLRQTATMPKASGKARASKKQSKQSLAKESTGTQFDGASQDDSIDEVISKGISFASYKSASKNGTQLKKTKKSAPVQPSSSPPMTPATPPKPTSKQRLSPVEVLSSGDPLLFGQPSSPAILEEDEHLISSPPPHHVEPDAAADISVIDLTTPARHPSRLHSRPLPLELPLSQPSQDEACLSSSPPAADHRSALSSNPLAQQDAANPDSSMAWLLDDDEELSFKIAGSSPLLSQHQELPLTVEDSEPEVVDDVQAPLPSPDDSFVLHTMTNGVKQRAKPFASQAAMPPPALPMRFKLPPQTSFSPPHSDDYDAETPPPLTFAVRAPGVQAKKRVRTASFGSSPLASPPAAGKRLRRQHSPESSAPGGSPKAKKRKKHRFADIVEVKRHNPWVDVEASHSGDELSGGGSEEDDVLSESDRQFIAENPTQASPSYDQSAVYRRSLLTQVPGGSMPAFARGPVRRGGGAFGGPSRPQVILSSSPPREEGSDDYYEFGSFVVDDEAEISYADGNEQLSDL